MNPGLGASSSPMVAIRCNGLTIDSIIGIVDCSNGRIRNIVDGTYLRTLVKICNLRFEDNKRRVNNFGANIEDVLFKDTKEEGKEVSEDKEARKLRKREEGLKKQIELKVTQDIEGEIIGDDTGAPEYGFFLFELCPHLHTGKPT
jgi:tRNA wybutosine-synthesizing protein 3